MFKKTTVLFIFFAVVSFISAKAQTINSIVPIIGQSSDYVKLIEDKYKQQIVNIEYDVIQDDREIYRELYKDILYGIIIYGDNNVKDLDLFVSQIVDDDWKIVAQDDQTQGMVMLYFTPTEDAIYKLKITAKLYNPDNFGFYGVIIFR